MTIILKKIIIKTVKEDKANQTEETDMINLKQITKKELRDGLEAYKEFTEIFKNHLWLYINENGEIKSDEEPKTEQDYFAYMEFRNSFKESEILWLEIDTEEKRSTLIDVKILTNRIWEYAEKHFK